MLKMFSICTQKNRLKKGTTFPKSNNEHGKHTQIFTLHKQKHNNVGSIHLEGTEEQGAN